METKNILITMKNGDQIKAELYPEIAPETVQNFLNLIEKKFYDGLTFHRVIKGFMIQALLEMVQVDLDIQFMVNSHPMDLKTI